MIPYILAAVGGYLIGQSRKDKQFADGGMMSDGGHIKISSNDVKKVAERIGIHLTEKQKEEVIKMYPEEQLNDPEASWDLVVENLVYQVGQSYAKGGNVRSLLKNFNEEKPTIVLIMIADDVSSDFMKAKFDRNIKWSELTDAEKQKYNEDYRVNKSKFETYLMYEFVKLYYSDEKIKQKCKGSSRKTIDAIKSVMTDLASKYDESNY